MIATEAELELGTAAAAEALFGELRRLMGDSTPWHALPIEAQASYLLEARPIAAAVLAALPDRAPAARVHAAAVIGRRVREHLCTCGSSGSPSVDHEAWCAGSVVDAELE